MRTDTYATTEQQQNLRRQQPTPRGSNRLSSVDPEAVGRKAVSILDTETKRALGPMALRKAGATLYKHTATDYAPTT